VTEKTIAELFGCINNNRNRPTDKEVAAFLEGFGIDCGKPLDDSTDISFLVNFVNNTTERPFADKEKPVFEKAILNFFKALAKNKDHGLTLDEAGIIAKRMIDLKFSQRTINAFKRKFGLLPYPESF
jgi:hypothetical protein